MNIKIKTFLKFLIIFLSSIIYLFIFAEKINSIFSFFIFIPYIYFIKTENMKFSMLYSFLFGFFIYVFGIFWLKDYINYNFISIVFNNNPLFINELISFLIFLIIISYYSFFYVIITIISKLLSKINSKLFYIFFILSFSIIDSIYPRIISSQCGYLLDNCFYLMQSLDIFGVNFLTFIVLIGNASFLILLENYFIKKGFYNNIYIVIIFILVFIISNIYGFLRINEIQKIMNKSPKARIGLVQGNINIRDKKNFIYYTNRYNFLAEGLFIKNPELIVFPENSIPFPINEEAIDYSDYIHFNNPPVILGITTCKNINEEQKYYNSIILIQNKMKISSYNKNKLIFFAETIPKFLKNFNLKNFDLGKTNMISKINNIKISYSICIEGLMPNFINKIITSNGERANLLINSSSDLWSKQSYEAFFFVKMIKFRSVENRISIVRASVKGFSSIIDPLGNFIDNYASKYNTEDSFVKDTPLVEIKTFYQEHNFIFSTLLSIILFIILLINIIKNLLNSIKKSSYK